MGAGEVSESDPHRMEAVWLNCTAPPAPGADGCDAVCMDGSRPLMYVRRGVGDGAHKWHIHHQVGTAMADRWRHLLELVQGLDLVGSEVFWSEAMLEELFLHV